MLQARELSCLADPWLLRDPDGEEIRVAVLAAYPDRVVVAAAPYGYADPTARPVVVLGTEGADRLRPMRCSPVSGSRAKILSERAYLRKPRDTIRTSGT